MDSRSDTIAAIATAPGRSGVAVVRVSGPDAFAVGERVAGRRPEPGRVFFARFGGPGAAAIDNGLLLAFAAPHSYTGEDVVELQCHGGSVAPRRVLEACFAAGARLARRGEFTERAFLYGKISYEQAEGVIDLIDAKTARAADAALEELEGGDQGRTGVFRRLYDATLEMSATVEHSLDVSEEELPPSFFAALDASLSGLRSAIRDARRRLRERKLLRDGALVVLAGAPNAGKSSLMNALLGESRAIVSATPGTTRDSIEEWLDVGGWPVRLVDTAGLRESSDAIEAEGVRRSESLMGKADLVLMLEPAGEEACASRGREASGAGAPTILIASKCDIARGPGLNVSSVTGEGLDALRAAIAARLAELADSPSAGEAEVSSEVAGRRMAALAGAESALAPFEGPSSGFDLVLFANALRDACERLGAVCGATYSADLLDSLFSRFCVGK
ncbi:MAG: tRNA uridine-5-carboxymethylaminomethyl(34) synthesis GTPase MnmE [Kiritimatiellae bacterium]|nr:tRNA uridine-5-carboxymethylaminomethyl(34) synthesis GTPase MnmE [Kiritimatiellia bacterium]